MKKIAKVFLLVGMVCFLFPFAMVSCSGEEVAKANGIELMTSITMQDEIGFDEDTAPNPYLIISFVLGAVGFACLFKKTQENKMLIASGGCGLGAAVFLLVFRSTFRKFYDLTGYESMITVEFLWGWILSLISFIVGGCMAIISYYLDTQAKHEGT